MPAEKVEETIEENVETTPEKSRKPAAKAEREQPSETRQFVLPGDMIGTTEEFIPNNNTFNKGGNIYSTATGQVNVNLKTHVISVVPGTSTPPEIENGDVVIGRITGLRSSMALVEIAKIEGKGEREIVNLQQAAIHISNVKDQYVKDISYEFGPFDIIKAKVIDLGSMRLSTSGKNLGVIKAYCSKCHVDLGLQSNNGSKSSKLKCPVCGNLESRNLSSEYGSYLA